MPTWSFYDIKTGLIKDGCLSCKQELVDVNTPPGTRAIKGPISGRTHRVDVITGEVVAWVRPVDPDSLTERVILAINTKLRIRKLELDQARPLRELYIDPSNAEARRRLEAIEAEIAKLRAPPVDLHLARAK